MSSQEPPKKKSKQVENKQGTLLSWIKPCTSGTEPGVVEETIRIKEQPESNCLANFPPTISQTSSLFRQKFRQNLETRTQGIVDKCSDLICTLTEGPKRDRGGERELIVNVGHSQIILSLLRAWSRRPRGSVNKQPLFTSISKNKC